MSQDNEIRVRFAPSPTGFLHVGGLRTALFNYLFARKNNGKFILRIEDTDRERFLANATENLLDTIKTLGLKYDEGPIVGGDYEPYIQSERTELYKKYTRKLLEKGEAYYCFCESERLEKLREKQRKNKELVMYDGKCRNLSAEEVTKKLSEKIPFVIRLKFPKQGKTLFYDKVRGKVEFDNSEVDDQILVKSDGYPTYHLANVVDDHLMKISHVIRGEEWISSVPKHIYLYKAFEWKPPKFVHLPLLLNPDKGKLSKRQGDVAVEKYLQQGFLPEALLNFVALLGWHASDDREIYSIKELESSFSLKRITKSGAVWDIEKLKWMNGQYMRSRDLYYICEKTKKYFEEAGIDISNHSKYHKVIENGRKRASTLAGIVDHSRMFYQNLQFTQQDKELLAKESSKKIFSFWLDFLKKIETLDNEEIKTLIRNSQKELGIKGKDFYFPLRLALYGSCHGPDIPTILYILGKDMVIKRLKSNIARSRFIGE